jgi:DNA-directed RNA polymerase specialized sigma24 family protein
MAGAEVDRTSRAAGGRLGYLLQSHADGAVRLAYLLTGDRAMAEDLVQDAFGRAAGLISQSLQQW